MAWSNVRTGTLDNVVGYRGLRTPELALRLCPLDVVTLLFSLKLMSSKGPAKDSGTLPDSLGFTPCISRSSVRIFQEVIQEVINPHSRSHKSTRCHDPIRCTRQRAMLLTDSLAQTVVSWLASPSLCGILSNIGRNFVPAGHNIKRPNFRREPFLQPWVCVSVCECNIN